MKGRNILVTRVPTSHTDQVINGCALLHCESTRNSIIQHQIAGIIDGDLALPYRVVMVTPKEQSSESGAWWVG